MNATLVLHQERAARILLVEDNPGDVLLIKHMLKTARINNCIDVAQTGEEVLALLNPTQSHELPNLILLDLNLPGISGHQVLEVLKTNELTKHIPVIILSSSQTPTEQNKSSQLGASEHLVKPMNIEHFNKMLTALEPFRFSTMVMPD